MPPKKKKKPANSSQKRRGVSNEALAVALAEAGGIYTEAAKIIGTSRANVSQRVKRSPALQKVVEQARESLVDLAESQLKKKIRDGNMTAIIFALKTQGKERGYVERQEVQTDGKVRIVFETEIITKKECQPAKPPRQIKG